MAKLITICAGIDTGKRKLDVALDGSSEQLQIDNTPEGYKALLDWLRRHRVKRIGIEASGGYEQAVVVELRRKRFVVVVFQPAQVRAYLDESGKDALEVRFGQPLEAVTPGQAVVCYGVEGAVDEDVVLGGGWITAVEK